MIKYVEGSLLEAPEKYICHQCNCLTKRAANLALSVFSKFPHADIYKPRGCCDLPKEGTPGTIIIKGDGITERYVINMLGQVYPGFPRFPTSLRDGFIARRSYFQSCLDQIAQIENLESIAFPHQIGCGAAGGNWSEYQKMIENFSETVTASVVVYKLKEPANVEEKIQ